jgi:hypothetical protein
MTYTQDEIRAFERMLPALGQHVVGAGIGGKAFNDLSRDEVLAFCAATVRGFRAALNEVYQEAEEGIPF